MFFGVLLLMNGVVSVIKFVFFAFISARVANVYSYVGVSAYLSFFIVVIVSLIVINLNVYVLFVIVLNVGVFESSLIMNVAFSVSYVAYEYSSAFCKFCFVGLCVFFGVLFIVVEFVIF